MEKQRLTEEGLRKMKKALLQASHRSLPHCSGSSTKKKEELIQEIMRYHPSSFSTHQIRSNTSNSTRNLKRTREFHEDGGGTLLFSTSKDAPVVDFYITHYNLADRINRNFYNVVDCCYHRSWKKLLFFALLMTLVTNA
jgi:hypothetical protein